MKVLIGKWGRSAAVRLPKAFLDALGLKAGDEVELKLEDGKLVVEPKPKPNLEPLDREALFERMKHQEPPELVDWGPPRGNEFW